MYLLGKIRKANLLLRYLFPRTWDNKTNSRYLNVFSFAWARRLVFLEEDVFLEDVF